MQTVSRRGLFVIGGTGAAGAVLAGCGGSEDDPRGEGRDPELLAAALAAETALGEAYASPPTSTAVPPEDSGSAPRRQTAVLEAFRAASAKRAEELTRLAAGASGASPPAATGGAGDQIEAAEAAIAAYRAAAGPLSTGQLRGTAIAFLAAVAAELSVLLGFAGEDRAPRAFVTGLPAAPYVAADDSEDEATETTTTRTGDTTTEEQP